MAVMKMWDAATSTWRVVGAPPHEHGYLPGAVFTTLDHFTQATIGDNYPDGASIFNVSPTGGWPDHGTVVTNKSTINRMYQEFSRYSGGPRYWRTYHSVDGWSAWMRIPEMATNGQLTLTNVLTLANPATTGNDMLIQSATPQIQFQDTDLTGGGKNWWIHVNSGNFYLLTDRTGDGAWESPHPMVVTGSTGAINFGTAVTNSGTVTNNSTVTNAGIVSDNTHHMHKKLNGSTHPTALNVMNWGDNTSALTGYLIIKTNMTGINDMAHIGITGYSYETGTAVAKNLLDLVVSGYMRPTTTGAVNAAYTNRGRQLDLVRWAKDASGYYVLILGSPTDVWRYPQVVVDWFKYRHSTAHADTDFNGWTAAVSTDLTPYTYPFDVPNITPGWHLIKSFDMGTGALNTVTTIFSGIPTHYTRLRVVAPWLNHASTSNSHLYVRFNGDAGTNYAGHFLYHTSAAEAGTQLSTQAQATVFYSYFYGGAGRESFMDLEIYQQASRVTMYNAFYGCKMGATTYPYGGQSKGSWNNTARVTSISTWGSLATNWSAGSRFYLYGMVDH